MIWQEGIQMKTIAEDLFFAVMVGLVIPAVLLGFAAGLWEKENGTIPEFTAAEEKTEFDLPILLQQGETTQILELDDYLTGVLLAEMPASFHEEALKAQAVASRTFAWKAHENGGKHGDGSVCGDPGCCQAYRTGADYLLKGGTEERLEKVRQAVAQTSGIVIVYEDSLIEATYFACSGGKTEQALAVWGTDYPYLQSVDSPGEEEAAHYADHFTVNLDDICRALGLTQGEEITVGEITRTDGDGVEYMEIGGEVFSGTELREKLGLRSTAFDLAIEGDLVLVNTKGYGHRVGMSQYGAEAMAQNGSTWQEILQHYYPGTQLSEIIETE